MYMKNQVNFINPEKILKNNILIYELNFINWVYEISTDIVYEKFSRFHKLGRGIEI